MSNFLNVVDTCTDCLHPETRSLIAAFILTVCLQIYKSTKVK